MDAAGSSQASGSSHQGERDKDDAEPRKANVRKRTKTGCITCRKRRIKCDEQHPQCRNCIKSKRLCEGYVKKFGWKPPLHQGTYADDHNPHDASIQSRFFPNQPRASPLGPLALIAPRPLGRGSAGESSSSMPTTYGPHHMTSETSLREFTGGMQVPFPNPLLLASEHSVPSVPSAFHQEDGLCGPGLATTQHSSGWSDQHVGDSAPPISNQQPIVVTWDGGDEDALGTDESVADTDEEMDTVDALAMARAQKRSESWPTGNTFASRSTPYGRDSILARYLELPHHVIFQNPELLQAFQHFLGTTAPAISLYERAPYRLPSDSERFTLWSYTLPAMALKHPSLLHAIIALGSFQQANLRHTSNWTAMKQYHLSIRRLAKNVSSAESRTRISTLAATLLLGYFEVYQSEHASWCNHLFGASILLGEMPIADMTRRCLAAKRLRELSRLADGGEPLGYGLSRLPAQEKALSFDYDLLSLLSGHHIAPEHYGLRDGQPFDESVLTTTENDIEKYQTLQDLLWWYNKLDVYQSFLGGSKLLRSYDLWTLCPPRAPLGDENVICGTYDHVMLLLGRLASFASKDLVRKRKAARPPKKGESPQFPGIVPTTKKVTAPRGFSTTGGKSPQIDLEDANLDISVKDALREWESIRRAFEVLKSYLDKVFKPLPDGFADKRESPFGAPLQYRSFAMAGIWMNYYMGMIQLHRYHPAMPPAAMPAAHEADSMTKDYAILIGRIAAGLSSPISFWANARIDVHQSAAFVESAFCLFVAGVQYKDNDQRHWTVRRMQDIVELVGWKTGVQIANALEAGWTKVAQMGRGPPYTRAQDLGSLAPRHWENPRRVDRLIVGGLGDESRGVLANPDRANLALGLIGIEDDLAVLELDG